MCLFHSTDKVGCRRGANVELQSEGKTTNAVAGSCQDASPYHFSLRLRLATGRFLRVD